MGDIEYKVKMIYRNQTMELLFCFVGCLSVSPILILDYCRRLQDSPPAMRSAGMSFPIFIISLILMFTIFTLRYQSHEAVFELILLISGGVVSLILTTVEDGYVNKALLDQIIRDKYYLASKIWIIITYLFLFIFWIGMRKYLRKPLDFSNRLGTFVILFPFVFFILILTLLAFYQNFI